MKSKIREDYFNWLVDLTCDWCSKYGNYSRLMSYLYSRQFTYFILNDANRASDGMEVRFKFVEQHPDYNYKDVYLYLAHPCNVLEMMTALASRCEDHIMGDPSDDDHTGVWFWEMITNMHLDPMTDEHFNERKAEAIVNNMMEHKYQKDGDGGLFLIHDKHKDMRKVELWCQLSWYLSEI